MVWGMSVHIDQILQGYRFCEDGVIEPDPNRKETWFFSLSTIRSTLSTTWSKNQ